MPTSNDEPVVDMDDTTGSNGGSTTDRFLSEADDNQNADSTHPSEPGQPRSDLVRTDKADTSGSTGDTATAQSAGRSQY